VASTIPKVNKTWCYIRDGSQLTYSSVSEEVANKSMLSSKNIRPPVLKVEDGDRWLRMLAVRIVIMFATSGD
jgi:hypothetical protein